MVPCPAGIRWIRAAALGVLLAAQAAGAAADTTSIQEVTETVRRLEEAVRRDRERLLLLVSVPRAPGATPLHLEPELKEIARRLPQLERELERWARLEIDPALQAGE